ncbi:2-hydroxyacyl-CoA dehydratase family protein [Synechococcus sp. FGCU-3]|nr:2-hydroxyacyl-CoA dehydratase family protein [Synechococcus sp. FGCU3]
MRPQRPLGVVPQSQRGGLRPTFLTLRDHGKVFVADLPRLSDGQLAHVAKEAREVLESLSRRLEELEGQNFLTQAERDTRIRASTKRDVTERFIRAIEEEQELRRNNPALRAAAGESLARAFMQLARHRLPGATFDSLLQEALAACGPEAAEAAAQANPEHDDETAGVTSLTRPPAMPVVLTPEPVAQAV